MALPAGRYGVTKNQLLKIKKLPMNTIKLIEELTEKFNLLGSAAFKNSTSVVTDSSDLVESGAVYKAIDASVGFVSTGKNKLQIILQVLKNANTGGIWNGNVYTYKDTTFTVNDDGTITANGTPTGSGHATFQIPIDTLKLYGDFKFNGAVGGSANAYDTFMWDAQTNSRCKRWNGTAESLSGYTDLEEVKIVQGHPTQLYCRVFNGYTVNNITFYPMITDASEVNPTFEPYHASVEESLEQKCDNSVIGTVEDGTNPTRSYAVGEHMIRGGKFCTVTVAVTTSSTWTLGGNYVEGTIADNLVKQATFSGTTSASGTLTPLYNGTDRVILGVKPDTSAVIILPYRSGDGVATNALVLGTDVRPASSITVSGTYYYI